MPDTKVNERLLRIRAIDELLSSQPGKTFLPENIIEYVKSKINDREYNRFKFARDMKFLENDKRVRLKKESCLPTSGVGRMITKYGYEDLDASIFHDNLSLDDKLLIKDLLDILQLKGIESLNSFMKFEKHYGKEISKKFCPIISFTKNPDEKKLLSTRINNIFTCIRQKTVIKIKMQDRLDNSKTATHTVHPWYLREYNRRWYLFGLENDEISHYALDRMQKIYKYEKITYRGADRSMDDILENVVGISFQKNDPVEHIIFWVSYKSSDFVQKKPIHKSMKKIDKIDIKDLVGEDILEKLPNKDGIFVEMKCIINYELKREMMSFGKELIVLYPKELRAEIKRTLTEMCDNY